MNRSTPIYFGIFLFALFFAASCSQTEVEPIPVEDFFSYAEKNNFRVSPDGRYISYMGAVESADTREKRLDRVRERRLVFVDISEDSLVHRPVAGDFKSVNAYTWISDNEMLLVVRQAAPSKTSSARKSGARQGEVDSFSADGSDVVTPEAIQLFVAEVPSGNVRPLSPAFKYKLRFVSTIKNPDHEIVIGLNARDSSVFDVYKLNVQNGQLRLVSENPGNIIRWFADLQGMVRMAVASDSIRETILFRDKENEDFRPVLSYTFHNSVVPMGFVKQRPDHIFALSNLNRDKLSLVEIDMRTGKERAELFRHSEVDISNGGYFEGTGTVGYALYFTWKRNRHFIDDEVRRVYERLEERLPGYDFRLLDVNASASKLVVTAFTDRNPGITYFFDSDRDKLIKLTEANPHLDENRMAAMQPISYQTRDSIRVHGYLTLPNGVKPRLLPVIVFPHGGPSDRNVWEFNRTVQFFANRGYAVFQVNFRGSIGYGKGFWTAGFKEWGGKIQDDITDGVRWLVEEGIADPNRIGIYGTGFGGYSALHAACFNPELYACVASYAGFTNLFTHIKEIPPHLKPYLQKYYEIIGNPETESTRIREMSPVFHADNIRVPVFIAQGGRDSRTTITESRQFVQKLRKRNVPVTLIMHPDEDRYFRKEENLIHLYEELGHFFDAHLKNR